MPINLYKHQAEALTATAHNPNVGYFLDMGLGKTYVGSEALARFDKDTNLLVCQKSKVDDWIEHFKTHYPDVEVYDLTNKARLAEFVSHDTAWAGWHGCTRSIGVINYELAFRRPQLKDLHGFTLMLDESSLIQNEDTKRARYLLKLDAAHVILLSGTVVNGNYERLWSQCQLLGWPITKKTFWQHYVVTKTIKVDGYFKKVTTGEYKNIDRLKRKLAEYGAVFMRTDEVVELPTQNDIFITVPPSKEYKEFCNTQIITVDDQTLIGDMQLTARMYERMLCGHFNNAKL